MEGHSQFLRVARGVKLPVALEYIPLRSSLFSFFPFSQYTLNCITSINYFKTQLLIEEAMREYHGFSYP
jgi:hypothetical protein